MEIEATFSHMSNPLVTLEESLGQQANALNDMSLPSLPIHVEDEDARECKVEASGGTKETISTIVSEENEFELK